LEVLAVSIQVFGRVQGVAFRYSAQKKAVECNLTGFVKNLSDGSVFLEVYGKKTDVQIMIDWCSRGSARAVVTNVLVNEIPFTEKFSFFSVK